MIVVGIKDNHQSGVGINDNLQQQRLVKSLPKSIPIVDLSFLIDQDCCGKLISSSMTLFQFSIETCGLLN
jgi:hypothetical protein